MAVRFRNLLLANFLVILTGRVNSLYCGRLLQASGRVLTRSMNRCQSARSRMTLGCSMIDRGDFRDEYDRIITPLSDASERQLASTLMRLGAK